MAHSDFHYHEVDERAFAIFLMEGIHYFLDQDPPLQEATIIDYCERLWRRWNHMENAEKHEFHERAREELRRLRRYHRADIYREAMRNDIPDTRRRFPRDN
jgi:hypothetical protein